MNHRMHALVAIRTSIGFWNVNGMVYIASTRGHKTAFVVNKTTNALLA